MINPINFKGVQIGREMKSMIPRKNNEEQPTGFYQVVNFLNRLDNFDFKIKKPDNHGVKVDTYDKSGRRIATARIPIKRFATDPKGVIGEIGVSVYSGHKIGKVIFTDMFEASNKSADPDAAENAQTCNDYNDITPVDYYLKRGV